MASGATMLINVERDPRGQALRTLSGPVGRCRCGLPGEPDTGRLLVVGRHGELTPVVDGAGVELVLDRPTSVEFVGKTAYVVSVTGDIYRVDGL